MFSSPPTKLQDLKLINNESRKDLYADNPAQFLIDILKLFINKKPKGGEPVIVKVCDEPFPYIQLEEEKPPAFHGKLTMIVLKEPDGLTVLEKGNGQPSKHANAVIVGFANTIKEQLESYILDPIAYFEITSNNMAESNNKNSF